MSNVIKAYSVRYDDVVKKTIDSQPRFYTQPEMKHNVFTQQIEPQSEFVEGLNALVVEALPPEEDTTEKASIIIENANMEAQAILDQARQEAEQIKSDAFSAAKKKGYEDGMLQVKQEAQRLQMEYEGKSKNLQKQYEDMLRDVEPQMVQLIASLVQKITGVVVKDKEEVILFLIQNSIKNMDRCNEYTIRVSPEDYDQVANNKDLILGAIDRDVPIYITEDANLMKNQCLIETDLQVINCSLDIQLNNLITDLKLLGSI